MAKTYPTLTVDAVRQLNVGDQISVKGPLCGIDPEEPLVLILRDIRKNSSGSVKHEFEFRYFNILMGKKHLFIMQDGESLKWAE